MKSKIISLGYDVWNLVYSDYPETPPLGKDIQNNIHAKNTIFCNIPKSY